ncbi:hypothetical protein H0H92_011742 [Tricholoma furcatifolium]|nr:hypothetical protein H0H92_011742 [Tricholoma furcatifolium]
MSFTSAPTLSLTAVPGSFPFHTKFIALPYGSTVYLGSEVDADGPRTKRVAAQTNGWFAPQQIGGGSPVSPLPLSSMHSEVWWDGVEVYIRDLDSPFGTYVNNVKVTGTRVIRPGDVITLGSKIPRNTNTPKYISDEHLKPIIAKVSITGVGEP